MRGNQTTDNGKLIFLGRPVPAILLILLAGVIVYTNSFQVPFFLDDDTMIVSNPFIRNLDNIFGNSTGYEYNKNRIVGYLTFALNFHFGRLDVTGYHAVNLLIHLATALLVFALLRMTFRTPFFQIPGPGSLVQGQKNHPSSFILHPSSVIPLFAALLFVVHPVQTQAVTYISQRFTSLATLFYLLTVVLYVQARLLSESGAVKETHLQSGAVWWKPVLLLAGATASAVLAMKTKEISFTLPLTVLLYEVFFFRGEWKRRLLCLLPILATLPIVPIGVLTIGKSAGEILSDMGGGLAAGGPSGGLLSDLGEQTRAHTDMSRLDYLFTQFRVIVTYLRLLVLPINQNLDYDYPVYTTFFTPPVFLSFLLLAALLALAVYLFFATRRDAGPVPTLNPQPSTLTDPALRLISFGILWFFLTLSVESSLIPIADVIFEHRLYLPSVGAAAAFSMAFFVLAGKLPRPGRVKLPFLIAAVVVLSFSLATWQRNHVWGDVIRLWEDVVTKSPQKGRAYNNLGDALLNAGKRWEAIGVLSQAIKLDPYHFAGYSNMGRAYIEIGQSRAAFPYLRKAIALNPEYDSAYANLAAALIREKQYREAAILLEQNLGILGDSPHARFNLGAAYYYLGQKEAARRELAIVSRMDPGMASRLAALLRQ